MQPRPDAFYEAFCGVRRRGGRQLGESRQPGARLGRIGEFELPNPCCTPRPFKDSTIAIHGQNFWLGASSACASEGVNKPLKPLNAKKA